MTRRRKRVGSIACLDETMSNSFDRKAGFWTLLMVTIAIPGASEAQGIADSRSDSTVRPRTYYLGEHKFIAHGDTLRWFRQRRDRPEVTDSSIFVFVADSVRMIFPRAAALSAKHAYMLRVTLHIAESDMRIEALNDLLEQRRKKIE